LLPELRASSWRELTVRDGKGDKDRRTMLPEGGRERLREQLQAVRRLDEKQLGNRARHHLDPSLVQQAIRRAMRAAEINKAATSHCFRHS
jgi:site-specific recombinase XerD